MFQKECCKCRIVDFLIKPTIHDKTPWHACPLLQYLAVRHCSLPTLSGREGVGGPYSSVVISYFFPKYLVNAFIFVLSDPGVPRTYVVDFTFFDVVTARCHRVCLNSVLFLNQSRLYSQSKYKEEHMFSRIFLLAPRHYRLSLCIIIILKYDTNWCSTVSRS